MKIAIYHELAFGGALRSVEAYAVELAKRHEVVLFSVGDQGSHSLPGVKINKIPFSSLEPHGFFSRLKHDFVDLFHLSYMSSRVAAQINRDGFDVAFVHPSRWTQAPFLLSQLKIPTLYYAQEALRIVYDDRLNDLRSLPIPNRIYEKCNRYWRKLIDFRNINQASKIIVNSNFTKNNIFLAYGLKSEVCHLGVDVRLFHRQKIAKQLDVLFFGSPVVEEGYDLFEAAQAISPVKWKVKTLQRKSNGKGVSDSELVRLINQSKLVVSLEHHHPFGINLIESGACGVPVVAVREGGYLDSVQSGKTGLLINRDARSLAGAINRLLADSDLRSQMGDRAYNRVQKYWTWEKSAERLERYLCSLPSKRENYFWLFTFYICCVGSVLLLFRLAFRTVRMLYPAPGIQAGVVGFAQYNGYPLGFENIYFNLMFLSPIVIAFGLALWHARKKV